MVRTCLTTGLGSAAIDTDSFSCFTFPSYQFLCPWTRKRGVHRWQRRDGLIPSVIGCDRPWPKGTCHRSVVAHSICYGTRHKHRKHHKEDQAYKAAKDVHTSKRTHDMSFGESIFWKGLPICFGTLSRNDLRLSHVWPRRQSSSSAR